MESICVLYLTTLSYCSKIEWEPYWREIGSNLKDYHLRLKGLFGLDVTAERGEKSKKIGNIEDNSFKKAAKKSKDK